MELNISLEEMICHPDGKTFKTPVSFFLWRKWFCHLWSQEVSQGSNNHVPQYTGYYWGGSGAQTTPRSVWGCFPGEASALSCSGVDDHLRLQPFVLKPRLPPTAGAVPSSQQAPVSRWINYNNTGRCVQSSKQPTQRHILSCQLCSCQKHNLLTLNFTAFFSC